LKEKEEKYVNYDEIKTWLFYSEEKVKSQVKESV